MQLKTRFQNGTFPNRVALITDSFSIGGGLEHLCQIAKGMPDTTFGVFGNKGEGIKQLEHLENVSLYPGRFSSKSILEFSPDIIHFHHLKPLLQYYLMPPYFGGNARLILTLHGLHIHKYQFMSGFKASAKEFCRYRLEKFLFRKVDKIITVSKEDQGVISSKFGVDDPLYIPNGIDPEPLRVDLGPRQALRKRLGLPEDSFIFFTPARFAFQKGYDIFLQAIFILKDLLKRSNVKFVFAGDGEYFASMQSLASRLDIVDQIHFLGSRRDIYQLMKASDALILPSRYEGLPIALIEAAFAGLPMIASRTCGNTEIITHGETGLLFENESPQDLSNLISQVLNDEYPLKKFAQNALVKAVEEYHVSKMTKKLLETYQSV
jgi:glycosyltransferase involved in cell wall biosynthesis